METENFLVSSNQNPDHRTRGKVLTTKLPRFLHVRIKEFLSGGVQAQMTKNLTFFLFCLGIELLDLMLIPMETYSTCDFPGDAGFRTSAPSSECAQVPSFDKLLIL